MKLLRVALTVLIFISGVNIARAQNPDWVIDSFNADIQILETGEVLINETITADFKTDRHGIYRDIPIRYDSGKIIPYYTKVADISVTKDGLPVEFELIKNSANLRVKVGSADVWVTGENVYDISYKVTGVLVNQDSVDELYWNVTGNGWDTVIDKATATITTPVPITQTACYQGVIGSTQTCDATKLSESSYQFSASQLAPGEGMTIAVGWIPGSVPLLTATDNGFVFSIIVLGIASVLAIWFSISRYRLWQKDGKDPEVADSVVVQFDLPKNMSPAEALFLMNDKNMPISISATVMSLAQKGYITIEQIPGKFLSIGKDTKFKLNTAAHSGLRPHEKLILSSLEDYANDDKEVLASDLKNKFYKHIKPFYEQVGSDVFQIGYYSANPMDTSRKYVQTIMVILIGAFAMLGGAMSSFMNLYTVFGLLLIFLLLVPGLVYMHLMPKRTQEGTKTLNQVLGYKDFITTADKHRAKFYEDKNLLFEMMPYAVAFGLIDQLRKQVDKMVSEGVLDESQVAPAWLIGTNNFNDSLSALSDINKSLSTTMQSTPGGSGSSGGGSSGGGFGGGGGGSW